MEGGELFCYNHPKRATSLRCNRCERPICAQCAVLTPVGYRCKTCVREQRKIYENARWYDYPVVFIATGVVTGLGATIASMLGWWGIVAAVFAGIAAERVMNWAVHYRRGRYLNWAAVAGVLTVGLVFAILPLIVISALLTHGSDVGWFAPLLAIGPVLIYIVTMMVVLIGRLTRKW
jgi:hypothetical protein